MIKHSLLTRVSLPLHIFELSWSTYTFSSIWKSSSLFRSTSQENAGTPPSSFHLISLTFCVSKLFEHMFLARLLNFLETNFILSPSQTDFRLANFLWIRFCFFPSPSQTTSTNQNLLTKSTWTLCIFPRVLTLSGIPHSIITFCCWPSFLLCSLDSIFPL